MRWTAINPRHRSAIPPFRVPSRARSLVRRILDTGAFEQVLDVLDRLDRGRHDILAVLTYHRVDDAGTVTGHPGLVSASPAEFAAQMDLIARRFRVVGLSDVLDAREARKPLPRRAILLTFDDAYRDFAEHAWPVMRQRGLPATLFVPTAYPGNPDRGFWWDWLYEAVIGAPAGAIVRSPSAVFRLDTPEGRLQAFRQLRTELKRDPHETLLARVAAIGHELGRPAPKGQVLSWRELRSLAADGVTLAPHSRTHPLLDRVAPVELEAELAGSIADLEAEVGFAPRVLAYPSGSYSEAVREAVGRVGYRMALTTRRGLNRLGHTDWLAMHRINVGPSTSVNGLRAQLGRWALAWSR